MLFSEKITSACKKLNKESEHKNFLYTYSWTFHVFTHTNVSDHLQKQKYRNIGNKLHNKNYKCIFPLTIITFTEMCTSPPIPLKRKKKKERN